MGHRKQQIRHDRREGSAITVDVYMLLALGCGGTLLVLPLTDSHVLGYMKACQGMWKEKMSGGEGRRKKE